MIKTVIKIALLVVIVLLGYMLYESINEPIVYQEQYNKRKEAVVNRLKLIRDAQVAYKTIHNKYTGSFDTLIDFVKTGNLKVLRMEGTLTDSMLQAGMTEVEALKKGIIKRDTMFISVKDSICKRLSPDSMRFVPFVGKEFELGAGQLTTGSGLVIPVFEAKVLNKVYLAGLDEQQRINMDNEAKQLDRYPGLKVGSLEEANNNAGNWE
ncbi:MAG: hypothetical protein II951_01345 [Bacteroidales bacterium]|nr:hypothetical protein [Bacteroidales bacterium]